MRKIVICGQKMSALNCIKSVDLDICKLKVVTNPDGDWEADIVDWCWRNGIDCYVGNINKFCKQIRDFDPSVIFSIQARELFKPEILSIPKYGCVNIHFGLLPDYGGCNPITHAIMNGEDELGITMHYMDENFDTGNIIEKRSIPYKNRDAQTMYHLLSGLAVDIFLDNYTSLSFCPHDSEETGNITYYNKYAIDFNNAKDFGEFLGTEISITFEQIKRYINAYTFPEFQVPEIDLFGHKFELTVDGEDCLKLRIVK